MPDAASTPTISQIHGTLLRPTSAATAKHLAVPAKCADGLFILTNRLSPLKVATRVLANLSALVTRLGDDRRWPIIDTFRTTAGHAARALGFALQRHAWPDPSTGRDKRWIGYPVGRDERASLARFAVSFTVSKNDGTAGPLVILGLATVVDGGRIALTEAGWRLAIAPSPLLQESGSGMLSNEERHIFAEQIAGASGERAAVTQLLDLVVQADGSQTEVDQRSAPSTRTGRSIGPPRIERRSSAVSSSWAGCQRQGGGVARAFGSSLTASGSCRKPRHLSAYTTPAPWKMFPAITTRRPISSNATSRRDGATRSPSWIRSVRSPTAIWPTTAAAWATCWPPTASAARLGSL